MRNSNYKNKSDNKKVKGATPMDTALKLLSYKPRTIREVERHLDSKNFGEYEIQQVTERLIELGYVNDEAYAEDFIRSRLNSKPVSKNKLKEQLLAHEIDKSIIEQKLGELDSDGELGNALVVAEKFSRQFSELPEDEKRRRIYTRLINRGFSYDDAKKALEKVSSSDEPCE